MNNWNISSHFLSFFFFSVCASLCKPILIFESYTRSIKFFSCLGQQDLLVSGLCWGWHICVSACFSFQSEQSYKGAHTLISSTAIANTTGGNAEAGSVYRAKRHTFPLQLDLVRETSSSWWQARLSAPLCPQPRLPASVALQAGLLTRPQVIDKQIMETNKACLLSPHGDVAQCCWTHSYSRPTGSSMCTNKHVKLCCEADIVKWLCFHVSCYTLIIKASPSASLPLSKGWIFRLCECRMVLAQYRSKPSQRHRR